MGSGVQIDRAPDGTVFIVAEANGRTVKLRVTAEYARRLAARLVIASADHLGDMPVGGFRE